MEELSSESNLFTSGVCPWTQMHIVDILPLEQGNWVIVRLWYMWHLLFKTMSIKMSVCTQENIAKDNNIDPRVSCWLCWLSQEGCLVAEKLTCLSEWWESSPARLCRHHHLAQPPAVSPSSEHFWLSSPAKHADQVSHLPDIKGAQECLCLCTTCLELSCVEPLNLETQLTG